MNLKINNWVKAALVLIVLLVSVYGFMIKLPREFRHIDKELHSVFYFLAAAFLNILFTNGKLARHVLIFAILYFFGMLIEYAQEYSNQYFRSRIHGRYDPEDLKYNLRGLIIYSGLWICYRLGVMVYKKLSFKEVPNK
jgi:hypothetical protein